MSEPAGLVDHYVPGNRWDLLDGLSPRRLPTVTVVVVHFRQQGELDRTLAGIADQRYPAELIETIVVDDGSPDLPQVPSWVRLLRQEDRGFRAGAARNLGASAASHEILCFLDADTTPEPGWIRAVTRLPALIPEAVTVGRRLHSTLTGQGEALPIAQAGPGGQLPDPQWLRDGYRETENLLLADDTSYRYLISAVLCCRRAFFAELGGFDESNTDYGGEDWEWGHRAWVAGAVLAFVPEAVAWHDGPDWSNRDRDDPDRLRRKNAEVLRLAQDVPAAGSRGHGLRWRRPDVLIELAAAATPAAAVICVDSLLTALPDALVTVPDELAGVFLADGRVIGAAERDRVAACAVGARYEVRLPTAARLPAAAVRAAIDRLRTEQWHRLTLSDRDGVTLLTITSRRAAGRARRWPGHTPYPSASIVVPDGARLSETTRLEPYFGGW